MEPTESKEKCTEKDLDAALKKYDAGRLNAVSDGEEQPVGQEDFVQQLAKQKALSEASEQKVAKVDVGLRSSTIKDQLTRSSKDPLSILHETLYKMEDRYAHL